MSVLTVVTPITNEGTVYMEHLSRLMECQYCIACSYKRKHKCSPSFLIYGVFQLKDYIAMLFLPLTFLS